MEFKEKVTSLVDGFLQSREDLFLIDLSITSGDQVTVILDGDNGVTVQDCLDASRAIEFQFEKEECDFGLQVMSVGLSEPIVLQRQFAKNIARELDILLQDNTKIQGELLSVGNEDITLLLRYRRPKLIGKGKEDVQEERKIPYQEIKKALVVIKF